MTVTLSPETQRLIDERMRLGDYASPDDLIRIALESFEGATVEGLDAETQAAIDRAEEQADRGGGIPVDEAFDRLRSKHSGF
jgi:Arc/MetJ-type ribon-helix-helix transcriptional regulator